MEGDNESEGKQRDRGEELYRLRAREGGGGDC